MAVLVDPTGTTSGDSNIASIESTDYVQMKPDIDLIFDIRQGARHVKDQGTKYLPQYEEETATAYQLRLAATPWRPEFVDGLDSLASKPFAKPVIVDPDAPEVIQGKVVDEATKKRQGGFIDNVDGAGRSLHVFAREFFRHGIAYGLMGILVDYPTMRGEMTLAEERAAGARPYWCEIHLRDLIALYFREVNGRYITEHMRVREFGIERLGFLEVIVQRVRVYELAPSADPDAEDPLAQVGGRTLQISGLYVPPDMPFWELWETTTGENGKPVLQIVDDGIITMDEIPIVWYWTGEKVHGTQYRVKPPLIDLATTQLELYRALSRYDEIQTYAGSPMLKFQGMARPQPTKNEDGTDKPAPRVKVGPKTVVFCPPSLEGVQTDADFIQPSAQNMTEVRTGVNDIMQDMQRMAKQPTVPKTGRMVATTAAIDAAKSHSAIEAWALDLKGALDAAFKFTCQWLKIPDTVSVSVHTDFGIGQENVTEGQLILNAAEPGTGKQPVISKQTAREELARRGLLGPQFDEDQEVERMAEEAANDPLLQPADPSALDSSGNPKLDANGNPIVPGDPGRVDASGNPLPPGGGTQQ